MKKNLKKKAISKPQVYLVWQGEADQNYFNQYISVIDAVSSEGDGCEVYVAEPKFLGKFKRTVKYVKVKGRKD